MRTLLLVLCVALVGCKDHPAEGVANATPAARPKVAPQPPHAGGPVNTTPKELFADFTRPDADGLALIDKYRDGARFSGLLQTVDGDVVLMSVDGKNVISLAFVDPAVIKAHKAGEKLTVTCRIGGASGALMMVSDCVL